MAGDLKVMVAGHLCLDLIPTFSEANLPAESLFRPGTLTHVGPVQLSTGGAVSNTGIALAKMGVSVTFSGKVGDDEFGKVILGLLKRFAAVDGISISAGEASSYTFVLAPCGIDRILLHNPGTNDTFSDLDIDYAKCAEAALFHFGYPPLMRNMYINEGKELAEIFSRVRHSGVLTSLDMALPDPTSPAGQANWAVILQRVLQHVDIFTPSVEEILYMLLPVKYGLMYAEAGKTDFVTSVHGDVLSEVSAILLEWGAGIVLLKCGCMGLYLRTGDAVRFRKMGGKLPVDPAEWANRELWIPAFCCLNMVNAAGAGDCAIAGFLAAFLRGENVGKALRFAALAGYQNLLAADTFSGIQDCETTVVMAEDYSMEMLQLDPDSAGWHFDSCQKIWSGPNDRFVAE